MTGFRTIIVLLATPKVSEVSKYHSGLLQLLIQNIFECIEWLKLIFKAGQALETTQDGNNQLWKHDFFYGLLEAERGNLRAFKDICSVFGCRLVHWVVKKTII